MTVNNFAKKLGFKNSNAYGFKGHLHNLERAGAVEVKQAGYLADSLHHPKVVMIRNFDFIQQYFKLPNLFQKRMPMWKRQKKCRHRNFSIVATVGEVLIGNKVIKKKILKCGNCDFYLCGIEVDGVMKKASPLV